MQKHVMLIGVLAAVPIALYAQSGSPDVLPALLAEVRQLRIAMEQAAVTTPRVQLLASRIAVQSDRTSRAARDVDAVRQELNRLAAETGLMAARLQELEGMVSGESDPARRRPLELEHRAMKQQFEQMSAVEQRLRGQESELATAYVSEQGAWAELNRRLDELERELAPPRKQP